MVTHPSTNQAQCCLTSLISCQVTQAFHNPAYTDSLKISIKVQSLCSTQNWPKMKTTPQILIKHSFCSSEYHQIVTKRSDSCDWEVSHKKGVMVFNTAYLSLIKWGFIDGKLKGDWWDGICHFCFNFPLYTHLFKYTLLKKVIFLPNFNLILFNSFMTWH